MLGLFIAGVQDAKTLHCLRARVPSILITCVQVKVYLPACKVLSILAVCVQDGKTFCCLCARCKAFEFLMCKELSVLIVYVHVLIVYVHNSKPFNYMHARCFSV